jgi:flagellar biosynthetic protein FliQ
MNAAAIIDIGIQALIVAAKLGAPMLITALVVGFAISVFQSITQIQEVTLSFVPKAVAVSIALVISGQWMIAEMVTFTQSLFTQIPTLVGT